MTDTPNAATQVFHIPELLELILLSLPQETIYTTITTLRTIHLAQTTTLTWHLLIKNSTPLRQALYLPFPSSIANSDPWATPSPFPPAEPNPWIPHLLLNQRSWGSAWPFESFAASSIRGMAPTRPRLWTFSLELSRAQYERLPRPGSWRDLLVTSPPFKDFWYTRAFYELGSGRAPFVTHADYDPKLPKTRQRYRVHCPNGVTLGHLVDAFGELFTKHSWAKFVMVESLRCGDGEGEGEEEGPRTKLYYPGMSAEKIHEWN
jgi:hypothetical protein